MNQVWQWSSLQRKHDAFMNRSYYESARQLVDESEIDEMTNCRILDVGCGSGLIAKFINQTSHQYTGIDVNSDGLNLLKKRNLTIIKEAFQSDITVFDERLKDKFDVLFSNFCLYTVKASEQEKAMFNMASYLKGGGRFHIGVPSESYSALSISADCLKKEINRTKNPMVNALRACLLVPYQYLFVVSPIEKRVLLGEFRKYTISQITELIEKQGLVIDRINLSYGGNGIHVHGRKP